MRIYTCHSDQIHCLCVISVLACFFSIAALSALRRELSSVPRAYQHAAKYRFVISEYLPKLMACIISVHKQYLLMSVHKQYLLDYMYHLLHYLRLGVS